MSLNPFIRCLLSSETARCSLLTDNPAFTGRARVTARHAASRACLEALEHRRLLSFGSATNYSFGGYLQEVVTADFNNDGKLDLATTSAYGNNVSVRLGDGAGGFGAAAHFPTGAGPTSMVVDDFNGDAKPDLVTGSPTEGNVSALLGNGDGTFAAPVHTDVGIGYYGGEPYSLASYGGTLLVGLDVITLFGDVVGAVASGWADSTGHFSLFASYTDDRFGLFQPTYIAVGDLNGDPSEDVLTAANGQIAAFPSPNYSAPYYSSYPYDASALTLGDFTGDGKLDIISAGNTVDIMPGTGTGVFGSPIRQPVHGGPYTSVGTGDFNGDGKLDAVATDGASGTVSMLLGNDDGTLDQVGAFPSGTSPQAVVVGDFNRDGRPDVAVANGSGYVSVLLNDGVWVTVPPPALRIDDVTIIEGHAGTVNAVFTVTLDRGPNSNVSVNYATSDGSATIAGGDYVATSGTITFTPGQTSQTFAVQVKGDHLVESDGNYQEFFFVRLSDATNAQVFDAAGRGTIVDDEPRLSSYGSDVTEGDTGTTPMSVTVTLSEPSDQTLTVDYNTVDWDGATALGGVDFDPVSGTLTFLPGQTNKTFTVPIRGDLIDENDEFFYIFLSNSPNAFVPGLGLGHILDNDAPPAMIINNVSRAEGNSGTTPFTFTVSLLAPSEKGVSVNYATGGGNASSGGGNPDYQPKSGQLFFAAGQMSQTVTVNVYGDTRTESDEIFFVNLSQPVDATIADSQGQGTILNDESRGKKWVGPASGGNWSTASNWSPGGVPDADSLVSISSASINLLASASVSELSLHSGATLMLAPSGDRVFRTAGLFLDTDTTLDLNDNALVLDYSSVSPVGVWTGSAYDGVTGLVKSGHNLSSAASGTLTALAVAEARDALGITGSQTGVFSGQAVDSTSVLVKFTWGGDANLDGKINIDDYGRIDSNVSKSGTVFGWPHGDFNYDGNINIDDYGIIDGNIGQQGPTPLNAGVAGPAPTASRAASPSPWSAFGDAGAWKDEDELPQAAAGAPMLL